MLDLSKIPFGVLIAAEKTIGKNIMALSAKEDKTFEDLRDFAFVVKYCENQKFTLEDANKLTMGELLSVSEAIKGAEKKAE